jgi:hypothetical protein
VLGRTICLSIFVLALAVAWPFDVLAKVRTVSTDGEATVYLMGDYSGDFDLAYNVVFDPASSNHSWSTVTLMLLGPLQPSAWISVGLSRGYPKPASLQGFTASSRLGKPETYKNSSVRCSLACGIELRADKTTIYALVNGRTIEAWSRKVLTIIKPYVQLNGEVHAIGDRISARFYLVRAVADKKRLLSPTCAFTTQGVEARAIAPAGIVFRGARRPDARVTYVSLKDGSTGASCPQVQRKTSKLRAQSPLRKEGT